ITGMSFAPEEILFFGMEGLSSNQNLYKNLDYLGGRFSGNATMYASKNNPYGQANILWRDNKSTSIGADWREDGVRLSNSGRFNRPFGVLILYKEGALDSSALGSQFRVSDTAGNSGYLT